MFYTSFFHPNEDLSRICVKKCHYPTDYAAHCAPRTHGDIPLFTMVAKWLVFTIWYYFEGGFPHNDVDSGEFPL
jgi:hypothetical protein